jgi:2-dehydro-3-deoxyglucarate aldolase
MLSDKIDLLRKKVGNNKPLIGSWLQLPSVSTAKLMIDAGYDWLCLDLEHGEIFESDLFPLINLIQSNGVPCFVRVRSKTAHEYRKIAELGASGVFIPDVKDKHEIDTAYCNFVWPPRGERGIGFSPSNEYGKKFNLEFQNLTDPFIFPMIESVQAIDSIDSLTNHTKVDAYFVGPYDLSASLGVTGDFKNEIFRNAISKIEKSIMKNNQNLGIHVVEPSMQELEQKIRSGYKILAYSIDSVFLRSSCQNPIKSIYQ